MKSFKTYLAESLSQKELSLEESIEAFVYSTVILEELDYLAESEDLEDLINEGKFEEILDKLGLEIEKKKGIVDYLTKFTKGLGKFIYCAIKKDKACLKKLKQEHTKEEFIDFLLKLDYLTLHLVSGPLHVIEAATGWEIWAAVKDKAEDAKTTLERIKQALNTVKQKAVKVTNKALAPQVVQKTDELGAMLGLA